MNPSNNNTNRRRANSGPSTQTPVLNQPITIDNDQFQALIAGIYQHIEFKLSSKDKAIKDCVSKASFNALVKEKDSLKRKIGELEQLPEINRNLKQIKRQSIIDGDQSLLRKVSDLQQKFAKTVKLIHLFSSPSQVDKESLRTAFDRINQLKNEIDLLTRKVKGIGTVQAMLSDQQLDMMGIKKYTGPTPVNPNALNQAGSSRERALPHRPFSKTDSLPAVSGSSCSINAERGSFTPSNTSTGATSVYSSSHSSSTRSSLPTPQSIPIGLPTPSQLRRTNTQQSFPNTVSRKNSSSSVASYYYGSQSSGSGIGTQIRGLSRPNSAAQRTELSMGLDDLMGTSFQHETGRIFKGMVNLGSASYQPNLERQSLVASIADERDGSIINFTDPDPTPTQATYQRSRRSSPKVRSRRSHSDSSFSPNWSNGSDSSSLFTNQTSSSNSSIRQADEALARANQVQSETIQNWQEWNLSQRLSELQVQETPPLNI